MPSDTNASHVDRRALKIISRKANNHHVHNVMSDRRSPLLRLRSREEKARRDETGEGMANFYDEYLPAFYGTWLTKFGSMKR
ncbi:hypothetical protein RRG08_029128 [Elysia crispata]|uniref:Uncharacterized protein n=1 Tax=Elysia crispata TaxID=231223 RepID=A0AAE0Y685_9GAST|nr:hypothetical protein RRG08_029128 [Elysia crispata]